MDGKILVASMVSVWAMIALALAVDLPLWIVALSVIALTAIIIDGIKPIYRPSNGRERTKINSKAEKTATAV
ncbi:hypothetical protein GCM10007981_14080 [Thermocladium modestius]|uniref:Uncharacterized protein n=1 Tax=Thermocladium modestius TaxID=62609 RepID=A0A830GWQ6_9CREN|nr:hypothetical protein [Thermocladium modestius]GGP21602.1 hypothetical protein GCM10007981_14080 [Thermocladium modestius]